jgi:hypothetical protein
MPLCTRWSVVYLMLSIIVQLTLIGNKNIYNLCSDKPHHGMLYCTMSWMVSSKAGDQYDK